MATPTIKQEVEKWTNMFKSDIGILLLNRLEETYGSKRACKVLQEEGDDWEAFIETVQDRLLSEIDLAVDEMEYNFNVLAEEKR